MRRFLAFLAVCIWGTSASGTQEAWPALYDVVGVAADDVLNVRAGPGAAHPIVGELAPDARGVEVIEPNEAWTWGRVSLGEQSGWVSLSYLERHPGQWYGSFPEFTRCFGTEPFWNLDRTEVLLRFSDMGGTELIGSDVWTSPSTSRRSDFAVAATSGRVEMTGFVSRQLCVDGMSDNLFGISIELILSDGAARTHWSGCCTLADR